MDFSLVIQIVLAAAVAMFLLFFLLVKISSVKAKEVTHYKSRFYPLHDRNLHLMGWDEN